MQTKLFILHNFYNRQNRFLDNIINIKKIF